MGRRALPRHSRRAIITATAIIAAVGAGLAGSAPTGVSTVDAAFRALLAVLVVILGYRAPRSALAPAALGTVVVAFMEPAFTAGLFATAAAGLTLVSERFVGYRRAMKGVASGLLSQALPRLEGGDAFQGDTALMVALIVVPLAVGTYRRLDRRERRASFRVAAGALVAAGLLGGASAVAAAGVRSDVDRAVDAMEAGLDAARAADQAGAVERFETAAALFGKADRRLDMWWVRIGRAVPVVAQNSRALAELSRIGHDLATAAATAAASADPDDARLSDGRIDLAAVSALVDPLEQTLTSLRDARHAADGVRSPWLLPPLADARQDLIERVDEAVPDARTALGAARVTPGILGAGGERRYFVMFVTPAEARASGGILGNYAELTVTDGRIEMTAFGRNSDLNRAAPPGTRELIAPEDYVARYGGFRLPEFWQDVTFSPDFPSVAQAVEGLYPQSGGTTVDGAISVDPYGMAALLELTGPVSIPQFEEPLTSENAARVLLRDQYVEFADKAERLDFLETAAAVVFEGLTRADLPGPGRVADVLGPAVREGRIKVHSTHPEEQAFFEAIGLSGRYPPVQGQFIGVVSGTASGSKLDAFLRREIEYDAVVDPASGRTDVLVTVTLHNDAPPSGLPQYVIGGTSAPPGVNRSYLALYSPLRLIAAEAAGQGFEMIEERELGRWVATGYVDVPPQSSRTVRARFTGVVALTVEDRTTRVRLDVAHQALVEPDDVEVRIRLTPGWEDRATGKAEIATTLSLTEDAVVEAEVVDRANR